VFFSSHGTALFRRSSIVIFFRMKYCFVAFELLLVATPSSQVYSVALDRSLAGARQAAINVNDKNLAYASEGCVYETVWGEASVTDDLYVDISVDTFYSRHDRIPEQKSRDKIWMITSQKMKGCGHELWFVLESGSSIMSSNSVIQTKQDFESYPVVDQSFKASLSPPKTTDVEHQSVSIGAKTPVTTNHNAGTEKKISAAAEYGIKPSLETKQHAGDAAQPGKATDTSITSVADREHRRDAGPPCRRRRDSDGLHAPNDSAAQPRTTTAAIPPTAQMSADATAAIATTTETAEIPAMGVESPAARDSAKVRSSAGLYQRKEFLILWNQGNTTGINCYLY
jgi:hypothetical protein